MTQLLSGAAGQSRAKPQQCKQRPGENHLVSQTQQSQASNCSTFWSSHFHLSPWQMDGVCLHLWDCLLAQEPQLPHRRVQEPNVNVSAQIHVPTLPSPDIQQRLNAWDGKNDRSQNSLHRPPGTLVFQCANLVLRVKCKWIVAACCIYFRWRWSILELPLWIKFPQQWEGVETWSRTRSLVKEQH